MFTRNVGVVVGTLTTNKIRIHPIQIQNHEREMLPACFLLTTPAFAPRSIVLMDGSKALKRGDLSLDSNRINLFEQQQRFEESTTFKAVSPTIAGLVEKGYMVKDSDGRLVTPPKASQKK